MDTGIAAAVAAPVTEPAAYNASDKQKGANKTSRIPIKIVPLEQHERLKKPDWIRVKAATASSRFYEIKDILRA
ncbi:MAG: lipoyl synthase, partial [Oxalobacteraceae bacterium]